MKVFDADWAGVLDLLPAWSSLSLPARRRLLETLKPSDSISIPAYGEHLEETLESGILTATPTRVVVAEHARELVRVLRAMGRHAGLFEQSALHLLGSYLVEHFTSEELSALAGPEAGEYWYGRTSPMAVAEQVSSVEWIEGFLSITDSAEAMRWEDVRDNRHRPLLNRPAVLEATQRLVRLLTARPEGIALKELRAALPDASPTAIGAAVHAALRYVLVQATLDSDTLEPRMGVWPPIARRLSAPPPAPPRPADIVDTFHAAWLLEDMTAVLVAVASDPPRLRADDLEIFARSKQAIAARLIGIPDWVSADLGLGLEERVSFAVGQLRERKLVKTAGSGGRDLRLEASRAGTLWIGKSEEDRLRSLLDRFRDDPDRNPIGWSSNAAAEGFFPVRIDGRMARDECDARAALVQGLLALSDDAYYPVDEYLDFESRELNPYLTRGPDGRVSVPAARRGYPPTNRESWERAWRTVVKAFLHRRLAALGGIGIGRTADGRICFQLTEIGRYLLGAVDSFQYGHETDAEVIVQPNFEIVFLAPAPRLEAQIGRFAERVGPPPGVVFRLTREPILAAAEAGVSRADIVETLKAGSARDLPRNVERQIADWFGAIRHVSIQRTLLIRCPDAETAAKVRAAVGKDAHAITDTILEIPELDAATKKVLLKKLRNAGIFVES